MNKIETILKDSGFDVLKNENGYNLYLGWGLMFRIYNDRLEHFMKNFPLRCKWYELDNSELQKLFNGELNKQNI